MTRIRKRMDCLDDGERERLAAAFEALMRSGEKENYRFWADIHASCCPHRCDLFLPWHRAYVFAFETALQRAIDDERVTIPYWDWTVIRSLPDWFLQAPFDCSWRGQEPGDCGRNKSPNPRDLPNSDEVKHLLDTKEFRIFGGCRRGTELKGGCLENVHGIVHTRWLAGLMRNADTAAFDPIFWLHHSYVDKLWWDWQQTHTSGPQCLDDPLEGVPGPWLVRDVLDSSSSKLGYQYITCRQVLEGRRWDAVERQAALEITVPPLVGCLRVTLLDAHLDEAGEPPDALDVEIDGEVTGRGSLSFFGLGHQHARAHSMSGCNPPHGGELLTCILLRRADRTRVQSARLRLLPSWPVNVERRAGLHVGQIVLEMDDCGG